MSFCPICKESFFAGLSKINLINRKIEVCINCFFKDIQPAPPRNAPNYDELKQKRNKLIEERAAEIIRDLKTSNRT